MPDLYPHQHAAVDWLAANPRACLADDQGLGKTISAAVALRRLGLRQVLIVCPSVVMWNWQRELREWAQLDTSVLYASALAPNASSVITSHALIRKKAVRAKLHRRWDLLIVDESHVFRNPSQQTMALYRHLLPWADRVWCLTGTPMPNDPSELWTMLHCLRPAEFPERWAEFREQYCELRNSRFGLKPIAVKNGAELRARVRPHMLRRLKKDVLDLPALRSETICVRPLTIPPELAEIERKLRRALARGTAGAGEKLDAVQSVATPEDALAVLRECEDFARFRRLCGEAKIEPLGELLAAELAQTREHYVVFAHHRNVIAALAQRLAAFSVATLTGATSARDRDRSVAQFQDGALRVLVVQITAGGIGITLTRATEAVFAELPWSPGELAQARDRFYRIGQTQAVRVRYVSLAASIDETIADVLRTKMAMQREVLQ